MDFARVLRFVALLVLTATLGSACPGPPKAGVDGGQPGREDSGVDGGTDAGVDGGTDAGVDAGLGCEVLCASGHCLADQTCVACTEDSHCGSGNYCGDDHACHPGCSTNAACSSGLCLSTHDCSDCVGDGECAAGNRCGTGVCQAACDVADAGVCSATGGTCCAGACVDLTRDVRFCGSCDTACAADQFCKGSAGCAAVSWAEVCANPRTTLLKDGNSSDDQLADQLGASIKSFCGAGVAVDSAYQQDGGVVEFPSGRPLTRGGRLLVAPGGSFGDTGQKLVDYLEGRGITNVYDSSNLTTVTINSRDAGTLVSTPASNVSETHDYLIVELVRDPARGSLSLLSYGYQATGTVAAANWLTTYVFPNPAVYPDPWYLVEWNKINGNDTYVVRASGK